MGNTVVFVHGTGVREDGYESSYDIIQKQLNARLNLPAAPCFWGRKAGAQLLANGASIPAYKTTGGDEPSQAEQDLARWAILYADPWYELRLIADATFDQESLPPGAESPSDALDRFVQHYEPGPEMAALLRKAYFWKHWGFARKALLESAEYKRAVLSVGDNSSNHLQVLARAHVAKLMSIAKENYIPPIDGTLRDALVERLGSELRAHERGAVHWLLKPFIGLVKNRVTARLLKERGSITDSAIAFPTDVIYYQTRGQAIRDYIAQAVEDARSDGVILLAHSLGGIASVDLLVRQHLPKVRQLITVGSQAPLMYELNCLTSLEYGESLPDHFPKWLNIYDRRDALSYIGAGVFGDRVVDVEVDNQQPFPESHSAYWSNPDVWAAIKAAQ